jgi:tetratricopeptide (TPR) repeat protein
MISWKAEHVFRRSWWAKRPALVTAGLALLGGTSAVLTAAKATNPLALAGADGAAAATFVFGAAWQERYRRHAQRRDDQGFRLEDGCLVLADGRLPFACEITNPVVLGVHQAAAVPATVATESAASVPAYVPRDIDGQLREWLSASGFVLLVGDSTAGKSRAAFEALSTLPRHVLVCPEDREALGVAVHRAAAERRCVLWLDDLERYLGAGGLTPEHLGRLLTGSGHHRVVLATIRAAEQARITASPPGNETGRQTARDIRLVIGQARSIRVARMFTGAELARASATDWDPRLADALDHASSYGIAEYLAAGPELLRDWEDARASSGGPDARGAALVAAAIDIRRAGYLSPIPRALLNRVHEHYLAGPEHVRTPREPVDDAWAWATRPRAATTALLRRAESDRVEVFDYLVDTIQRRAGSLGRVPEQVVVEALAYASPEDADSLAQTAYAQGRYQTAEHAYRQAYRARAANPAIGPNHPDALATRNHLTRIFRDLGWTDEAEAEIRSVLDVMTRVLGRDHPDTLTSRDTFALLLHARGRLEEAEAEIRAALGAMSRVLGPDHPDTLTSRSNFAVILRDLRRLPEAEAEIRAVLDARTRVLGPDHPDTLVSHGILATVLRESGRPADAETEMRPAMDAMTQTLGPDHPFTLISRGEFTRILQDLGRLPEAATEIRGVLDAMTRVLGPDHPFTVINQGQFALMLRDQGRLAEAATEIRDVVATRNRVLGPGHPDTRALVSVLDDLRQRGTPA